jgi:hypothetical protein
VISNFAHYGTMAGRVARFVMGSAEFRRALEAAPDLKTGVLLVDELAGGESVQLAVRVAYLHRLVDVLEGIGGDSAPAGRMLRAQLEAMVAELRATRPPVTPARAGVDRVRAGAA